MKNNRDFKDRYDCGDLMDIVSATDDDALEFL